MSVADTLHKYPFLRLLLPLIAGIYFCDSFLEDAEVLGYMLSAGLFLLFLTGGLFCLYRKRYSERWCFGMSLSIGLFLMGVLLTGKSKNAVVYAWDGKPNTYIGTVLEKPQEKPRTILCKIAVSGCIDTVGARPVRREILLYLSKDSLSKEVKIGDELLFYGKVSPPRNNGNPNEFDYVRYLQRQGVSGILFASSGYWRKTGRQLGGIKQVALAYREQVLDYYRELGFSGSEYAVLAALTLGSKNDLSKETREEYSLAGVSHVLALSGLHIGLIYLLIGILLNALFRGSAMKVFRQCILILCLWVFAFMSGLSPSVLRSVIMFSFVAVSYLLNARPVVINTLAGTAFCMLVYHPFNLFDISFQLSFLAVLSIVMIQPYLNRWVVIQNRVLRYVKDLITVSFAAQIGTAPLVIYYFSNFSLLFWLANLLVIPLVTLILYGTMLLLCTSFYAPLQLLVAEVLHKLLECLNTFVAWVSHLPYSSLTSLNWHQADVLVFYCILLMVFVTDGLKSRRRQQLLITVCCFMLIFHSITSVIADRTPKIVFYNARNCPAVHFISSGKESYLLAVDTDSVARKLTYAAGGFWTQRRLETPRIISPDECCQAGICALNGIVRFKGYTVCMIKDNDWKNKTSADPLLADYLYLCDGYKGTVKSLMNVFRIKNVVLDSSLGAYRLMAFKNECHQLGINCISLSDKGALMVNIV